METEGSDAKDARFVWESLGDAPIPCVLRGEERYCSARSLRTAVRFRVSSAVFDCASLKGVAATTDEAQYLSGTTAPGTRPILKGDPLLLLSEARSLFLFLQNTHSHLAGVPGPCGLVTAQRTHIPYALVDGVKLAPVTFLEQIRGFSDSNASTKILKGWPLYYVRFCCKVASLDDRLMNVDQCLAVSLQDVDIKTQEYWPTDYIENFFPNTKDKSHEVVENASESPPSPPAEQLVSSSSDCINPTTDTPKESIVKESTPIESQQEDTAKRKYSNKPRKSRSRNIQNETSDQRNKRLIKMRLKQAERIANETPEKRKVRLRKLREYQMRRRANESAEERDRRLLQLRLNQSKRMEKKKLRNLTETAI